MAFDFPASPSVGAVFAPTGGPVWQFNGQGWAQTMPSMIGSLIKFKYFTANGTYTPDPQMLSCVIECIGGGGAGGGVTGVAGNSATGSGGGGGAYVSFYATKAMIGASQAVLIGAGGTAGGSDGGAGGDTSVGGTWKAAGGGGGPRAQSGVAISAGGLGGSASNSVGNVVVSGSDGGGGMGAAGAIFYFCGWGGGPGIGGGNTVGGLATNGRAGQTFGAGGSGGQSLDVTNRLGGAGQPGIVYITEYCSSPATGDDVIGGMITIASTAPSSPAVNDVWIDTT